jgi:hypothetical protein
LSPELLFRRRLRRHGEVGHHHAEEARAPRYQRAGGEVRPVAQLADALEDPLARGRPDVRVVAQDFRDGDNRDAEVAGDVLEAEGAAVP